jgi:tetratricopeptide (TPR) repeat protein
VSAPVGRNQPCPCGSGRRYKDCHGKLEAQAPDAIEAVLARALASHQRGALDEAERGYRSILERDSGHAAATHYLGMVEWQRGDPVAAEKALRASMELDASVPDFHNNLGLLLRDTGRADEAVACFQAALARDPAWVEAGSNLGLAHEAAGRWDDARTAYEAAIARAPGFAVAQQNLARVLLTQGELAQGWERYRWRLLAQGHSRHAPDPAARPLPSHLGGRRLVLLAEQGLGDVLFFLRFAPELVRRGAMLAFRGNARLHGMLGRTGLFAGGLGTEGSPAPGFEPIAIGDLPWLLEANDAGRLPPPLRLTPGVVPPDAPTGLPRVALTWRGGLAAAGPARTQLKTVGTEDLAVRLRGRSAHWISIQRLPRPGEREALEAALGAPVEDASALNDDLEAMLAFLDQADDYVGVSNLNTHLRAGLGKPATVLVPFPPEWRWMAAGDGSPWFPGMRVVRQRPDGGW